MPEKLKQVQINPFNEDTDTAPSHAGYEIEGYHEIINDERDIFIGAGKTFLQTKEFNS